MSAHIKPPSPNLIWQGSDVTQAEREQITKTKGMVIWLTGLSGSGKSTLAIALEKRLILSGRMAFCIDGDDVRKTLSADLGFSTEERLEHIRRVANVAELFCRASVITIVSVISPQQKMRDMARQIIGSENFTEVYVRAGLETCMQRDPKGLYAKVKADEIKQFTGISSPYEPPEAPDLLIDTEISDVKTCVDDLYNYVLRD